MSKIAVEKFFKFTRKEYYEVTKKDIENWKESLKTQYSKLYAKNLSSALSSFFIDLKNKGLIDKKLCNSKDPVEKYWVIQDKQINAKTLQWTNEYLLSLKVANYSKKYIDEQRKFFRKFFVYHNKPLSEISKDEVYYWIKSSNEINEPTTIRLYLSYLNCLLHYCKDEGYINGIPLKKRWRPKITRSVPKALTASEYSQIIIGSEAMSIRDRAIIEFFCSSGCRVSELININIKDVDLGNRTVLVVGKGKKPRVLHFSESTCLLLKGYLETRIDNDPALFVNNRAARFRSTDGIRSIVNKLEDKVNIRKKLTPHIFRHTFATGLRFKGADLLCISEELGHSKLSTTKRYAMVPAEQIVSKYRKIMG